MIIVKVRGHSVSVNLEEELREYSFNNANWTQDKFIASSPFRNDQAPSFFVNLTGEYAGTWGDSGALDEEYRSGNFIKLISLLRGTTYEEAGDYLLDKYGSLYEPSPKKYIRIRGPRIKEIRAGSYIEDNPITSATSPYLITRGISGKTQELFGVGYGNTARGYTAFPWYSAEGRLANIKYRNTRSKKFFYEKGATPVKELVYGIDLAGEDTVLCEGEIDAMSWKEAGIDAIALGGAHLSEEQAELIKRSRIKRLYLGGDNDEQGEKLNRQACRELLKYVQLFEIDYGKEKDANDVLMRQGAKKLREILDNARPIRRMKIRLS